MVTQERSESNSTGAQCEAVAERVVWQRGANFSSLRAAHRRTLTPMERRRMMLLAALLLVLGIGVFAVWAVWPREPSYQGRSLSTWMDDVAGDRADYLRAEEAIRQIGTNAMPFLRTRLALADDPSWKLKLAEVASRQSLIKIRFVPNSVRRFHALAACDALGPLAKDALPDLEKLLYSRPYSDLQVAMVIGDIGPDAIPSLTKGLTNDLVFTRSYCRTALAMARDPKSPLTRARDGAFIERLKDFHLKAAPDVDYEIRTRTIAAPR
jgi:hypothetical protein